MVDLSDNNHITNFNDYLNAGYRAVGLKGTESTNYFWDNSSFFAKAMHNKGGVVVWYAFAHPESGKPQADYFWSKIKGFKNPHDIVVIDAEKAGLTKSEVNTFIDEIVAKDPHVRGLIYGGWSFLGNAEIVSYKGWGLWLAEYGPTAHPVTGFKKWIIWQNQDDATVPGISGKVDHNILTNWVFQPTCKKGDKNVCVLHLKSLLKEHGEKGFIHTQKFGRGTQRAVNRLKKQHKWKENGVAGPRVWNVLR